ncbi:lipoprotein-releasing system transmembrane subunit LolC [Sandarakinorhabdus cyanobacteriorum]|uniref:Lipoprotein-releasing system transmembrane subunit LolC n=1 Tax=Sandarakinorhabdus cyanobacteriorum TaxID=1981098 RepID=A0A255Z1W4_9SPHN|nr:lipoprotein-releasing ABC transporter permease subunit [Sandarakinorhabdus cyanobacteriorum]OYQ35442.1 lipoprotein-releasing system transmembrane subunit LolC [Sandarakinorhabdus cyanobacteriorum]
MISAHERLIIRRYLTPGQGEGFIFLVAGISLVAVALGVAALIAVMSVMNGFRAELFDRIIGLNGHAVVQGYGGRLDQWPQVVADARALPGVTRAAPMIEQPLMASASGRVEGVIVRGLTLADIKANPTIATNVRGGSLDDLVPGGATVAIGARLAEQLGLRVGDEISLINPAGRSSPFGTVPRIVAYRIVAVFEVGVYDYDKAFVVMPLSDAQTLLRLDNAVSMVEVETTDPDRAAAFLEPLRQKLAGIAVVSDWTRSNAALFSAMVVEQTVMFWVLSIIILVAVFNILSSLIMLVRAKTRDIAILRTMGASRASMMRVFMAVGTLIGAAGVASGLALGFLLLRFRQPLVDGVSALTGTNIWDPSVRYLTLLPSKTDPVEVLGIVVLALGLSFLATLYPAWKAASTDPVTVLRYE